jgi:hypothetical protein
VSKRFYDHFKREHTAFLKFVTGITGQGDKEWYTSLLLNRLMFVYFIQKKGFLDGDPHYLRNRLRAVRERKGKGKFYTFYRYFLLALFHEGFAKQPQDRKLDADLLGLLGEVPYLNGGLFEVHQLEELYPKIAIPDEAFENVFSFLDQYDWVLDTRPLRTGREINPDVLGYIFEKYSNQKELGAYYTKEDITEYIAKNTILPHLFDAAEKQCAVAFQPGSALWRLLQDDPDRYIYLAVRQGVIDGHGDVVPEATLPEFVQKGMYDPQARMFSKEYNLGQASIPDGNGNNLALPTETWREYVARRRRCLELREKLQAGAIRQINDLITDNLNIRQFAEDVIDTCAGPELLRAFYQALANVTVLDPTCGSGAFLLAALHILQPLYEACLERMQAFVEDPERSGERHSPQKFADFRKVLTETECHPNRSYFILKSIMINNLYGVDVMEEAVEICKLRLFLKLLTQVDREKHPEPLPDLDFNIRVGNTLVGFVSLQEIRRAAEREVPGHGRPNFGQTEKALRHIVEEARIVERALRKFRGMQTEQGADARAFVAHGQELRRRRKHLAEELDRYLAGAYDINPAEPRDFAHWRKTHQPFHWFAEFSGIMRHGAFAVIIGNPPYVEYNKVRTTYRIAPCSYSTESAENLYAFCVERSGDLLGAGGRFGMIIPSSAVGLEDTVCLRDFLLTRYATLRCSTYSIRPSKLFAGIDQRLCIVLGDSSGSERQLFTTRYHHWKAEERSSLFARIAYVPSVVHGRLNRIAQLGDAVAASVLRRLESNSSREIGDSYAAAAQRFLAHYHRSPRYWIRATDFAQYFRSATRSRSVHHFRDLRFQEESEGKSICAIMNSSLFFFWFMVICNGRNLTRMDVARFPVGRFAESLRRRLAQAFSDLMGDYRANSLVRKRADCEYQEFRPGMSKPILDQIDALLAEHYGFSDEEVDFIINYDIKYRLGQDEGEGEEGR